jgi:hypothetical protein
MTDEAQRWMTVLVISSPPCDEARGGLVADESITRASNVLRSTACTSLCDKPLALNLRDADAT